MAFSFDVLLLALHLLAAAAWFGAGWYERLMISPALKGAGSAGATIIRTYTGQGGGARWFAPASMLTVLTGASLYWRAGITPTTGPSVALSIGAALGVAALLMGIFFHAPAEKRLKVAVRDGTDDEVLAVARHLERHTTWSAFLVTVAFLLMTLRFLF